MSFLILLIWKSTYTYKFLLFDDSVGSERVSINHSEMEKKLYMVKLLTYVVLHTGKLNSSSYHILNIEQMCAEMNDDELLASLDA